MNWSRIRFLLLLSLCLNSCSHWKWVKYRRSDNSYERKLDKRNSDFQIQHYLYQGRNWRFISVGDSSLPTLVVFHGAPGSISTFDPLLFDTSITNHIRVIAMDRPGYGYNGLGNADTSVLQQAKDALHLIHHLYSLDSYAVMGYSYGGPIAASIAAMDTSAVKHLYLVSAALIQGHEKIYGISHLLDKRFVRVFVPSVVCSANDEKLHHFEALNSIMGQYSNIQCAIEIYHGEDDNLIYPTNSIEFEKLAVKATVTKHYTQGGHHAYIWKQDFLIKNQLRTDLL